MGDQARPADSATALRGPGLSSSGGELVRAIGWLDAFWIASGVPALLVFSIGFVAVLDGPVSALVWIVSVLIGLGLAFVYAETAGMFPDKSGGPPVFGAQAWRRYSPAVAALDVWAYWFGWAAVQATGVLLIGQYVREEWAPGQDWSLGVHLVGRLGLRLDFAYVVGAAVLLSLLWANRFGVRESARTQRVLGAASLVPLALLVTVPILQGKVHLSALSPFEVPGQPWSSWKAVELVCAGLFVAGWSAYGFETAVAYTAEFRRPQRDTPRAIFAAGALCLFFYGLGPLVLYAVVGGERIGLDPSTALVPLADDVFGPAGGLLIGLLLVALLLSVNTAVLGCARTLYQAARDGWTFRFLDRASPRGVPSAAMTFGLAFNLALMLLGDISTILAAGAIGYMTFHTLNPATGWLLRRDAPGSPRPYRAPGATVALAVVLAAANLVFVFVGAPAWGREPVLLGWAVVLSGLVVYAVRRRGTPRPATISLRPMFGLVLAAAATLTFAAVSDSAWAWIAGLALAALWPLGFGAAAVRRDHARWLRW